MNTDKKGKHSDNMKQLLLKSYLGRGINLEKTNYKSTITIHKTTGSIVTTKVSVY